VRPLAHTFPATKVVAIAKRDSLRDWPVNHEVVPCGKSKMKNDFKIRYIV
jgi:hypothetical protein